MANSLRKFKIAFETKSGIFEIVTIFTSGGSVLENLSIAMLTS